MLKKIKEEDNKEHFQFDKSWSDAAIIFSVMGMTIAVCLALCIVLFVIYKIYNFATKKTQV
jgi:hypothetical protein